MSGPDRVPGLRPVDLAVLAYAVVSGVVVVASRVSGAPGLLAGRIVLVAGVAALARRADRSRSPALERIRALYPLLVCPLFFWEAPRLTAAAWEGRGWWLEPTLAAWDAALFGGPSTPATFDLPAAAGETLWALYFAYYPLVAAGLILAWLGPERRPDRPGSLPSPAFEPVLTATVLGFLAAYALFPFLPARAPIHALEGVRPASGGVFGSAVGWVQSWGGVTGSAFPSAHVSAAWAVALGLAPARPRAGGALALVAAGMTVACVWTPYHWAADVAGGLALGVAAGIAGPRWVARVRDRRASRRTTGR